MKGQCLFAVTIAIGVASGTGFISTVATGTSSTTEKSLPVCHRPSPGEGNPYTVKIALASVAEHLGHGDHIGHCAAGTGFNTVTYGRITWNEIWGGRVHVIGDIEVDEGASLTIEPGTIVTIAANSDVDNLRTENDFDLRAGINTEGENIAGVHFGEPWRDEMNHISIVVKGVLYAVGTPDNRITITSDSATPGIYDWNHLDFRNGIISYAHMSFYRYLQTRHGTVVSHSVLAHVGENTIAAQGALIEYNDLSDAGHELIDMHGDSSTIWYNKIGPNPSAIGVGIIVDGGAPMIFGNIIEGCSSGIAFLSPSKVIVKQNVFVDNGVDLYYDY